MTARSPFRRRLFTVLKILGALVLLLAIGFGAIMWSAFGGTSEIEDGKTFGKTVRIVKDGFVDVGVVDAGDGRVVLIDAGNDKAGKAILGELARRGAKPSSVAAIFLTHGHPDHTAACALFPDAAVYALAADVALAEGRAGSHGPLTRLVSSPPNGTKVTHSLEDGEVVTIGSSSVQTFAIPGHTAGSAAFLVDGVLFLGDSARATGDGKLKPAPWAFSDDGAQNRASLHSLADRLAAREKDIVALCPAHTGCLSGLGPLQALPPG